jgi:hypothetical protein
LNDSIASLGNVRVALVDQLQDVDTAVDLSMVHDRQAP